MTRYGLTMQSVNCIGHFNYIISDMECKSKTKKRRNKIRLRFFEKNIIISIRELLIAATPQHRASTVLDKDSISWYISIVNIKTARGLIPLAFLFFFSFWLNNNSFYNIHFRVLFVSNDF